MALAECSHYPGDCFNLSSECWPLTFHGIVQRTKIFAKDHKINECLKFRTHYVSMMAKYSH